MRRSGIIALFLLAAGGRTPGSAQEILHRAHLGSCLTAAGPTIAECTVGYRTFGRLNARRDNAVLVPTWYGGRSDGMRFLLGADAWIDTTRWFAILMDSPGNGVSISPSNSRTQPGRSFPRLTLEDMVAAQHRAVTEHLGIRRLHAVVGWSMGGMQALSWALRYPGAVGRVVSVAGTPGMGTYDRFWVRGMLTLLELAGRSRLPQDSLALRLAELWHLVGTTPERENLLPRDSVDVMLEAEARADWVGLDPEDNRVQLEAIAAFDALGETRRGGMRPGPRMLLVYVPEDHVTTAESFVEFARLAGADRAPVASDCGHLLPLCDADRVGAEVREYLERETAAAGR